MTGTKKPTQCRWNLSGANEELTESLGGRARCGECLNTLVRRNQVDVTAAESHCAVGHCVKRVVLAHSNEVPRVELGAALTHDDAAGLSDLPAVELDAPDLRVGVATILSRALTLLVCHSKSSTAIISRIPNIRQEQASCPAMVP